MFKNIDKIETRQPFADDYYDAESQEGSQFELGEEPQVVSFRDANYESAEMKQILSLTEPDKKASFSLEEVSYKSSKVFPDWVLRNPYWKNTAKMNEEANTVQDILKLDKTKRNPDQIAMVANWLMASWRVAFTMGFKACCSMVKALEYEIYQPGQHIIQEGQRGLTFYIIITGETHVHKDGIGIVGQLGPGKSFGEVALTQGKDLRTATVTAVSVVECARLHKSSYDYYARGIQDQEKREKFKVLSECALFKTWPKGKIEKMMNSCQRKVFGPDEYIFKQGDPPTDLCIIMEGNVRIVKELVIVCKNRWPVGKNEWKERTKRIHKPVPLKTLGVSDFFGEVAILKDQPRSTSAISVNRCELLSLDKNEFLHLISYGNSAVNGNSIDEEDKRFNEIISKYIDDQDILDSVTYFRGGPDSQAVVGDKYVYKHDLDATKEGQKKAPPPGASKSVVILGPTSHSTEHKQSYNKKQHKPPKSAPVGTATGTGTTTAADGGDVDMSMTLQEQLQKAGRADAVAEKLRNTAALSAEVEKARIDKLKSMGIAVPKGATKLMVPAARRGTAAQLPGQGQAHGQGQGKRGPGKVNRQASLVDVNGLIYKKAAAAAAARRGSLSFAQRRNSLQGVDNDPTFVYDPVVLLRNNSAIQLDKVYEHVQRHLQVETEAMAGDLGMGAGGRGFGASRSTKLSPLRRQSSRLPPPSPPPVDALQLMSQWSSYVENGGIISPSGASRKNRASRLGSNVWGPSGVGSPVAAMLNSGSRKKSSANPSIFGGPGAGFGAGVGGGIGPGVGAGPNSNSIAQAIAQAVAFANSSGGNSSAPAIGGGGAGSAGLGSGVGRSFSAPGEISASMKNRAPFASRLRSVAWQEHPNEEHEDEGYGFEDHDPEGFSPPRRASQTGLARDTSLKLLNKAKISYREVMEG